MTDQALDIAHGAEQARRAAWAKYYALARELDRWRQPDIGAAFVYVICPCCGAFCSVVVLPWDDCPAGPGKLLKAQVGEHVCHLVDGDHHNTRQGDQR